MEKGTYGYYKSYKKKKGLIALILLLLIVAYVGGCLLFFKTTKTVYIVPGVILALPFAKFAVAYILGAKYKSITLEEYEKVNSALGAINGINILYDITVSAMEVITGAPLLVIYDGNIYYIVSSGTKEKDKDIQKSALNMVIESAGYEGECKVTRYNNVDSLIEAVTHYTCDTPRDNASKSIYERLLILGL